MFMEEQLDSHYRTHGRLLQLLLEEYSACQKQQIFPYSAFLLHETCHFELTVAAIRRQEIQSLCNHEWRGGDEATHSVFVRVHFPGFGRRILARKILLLSHQSTHGRVNFWPWAKIFSADGKISAWDGREGGLKVHNSNWFRLILCILKELSRQACFFHAVIHWICDHVEFPDFKRVYFPGVLPTRYPFSKVTFLHYVILPRG